MEAVPHHAGARNDCVVDRIMHQYIMKQSTTQQALHESKDGQAASAATLPGRPLAAGDMCGCHMTITKWQLSGCMAVTCLTVIGAVIGGVLGAKQAATQGGLSALTCSRNSHYARQPLTTGLPFVEEFTALDPCTWSCDVGDGSDYGLVAWGNNELQCYSNSSDVVDIIPNPDRPGDGLLRIRQTYSQHPQPCLNQAAPAASPHQWTSGKLHTKNKRVFQWGVDPTNASSCMPIVIESRIKVPNSSGRWSAFWMMPQPQWGVSVPGCPAVVSAGPPYTECGDYGPWPHSGEIDILEQVSQDEHIMGTVHYANTAGAHEYAGESLQLPVHDIQGWLESKAVWGCEWIKWYVNGQQYFEVSKQQLGSFWPFNKPFFLVLNTAVGGLLTGGVEPDQSASEMLVDFVKVSYMQ